MATSTKKQTLIFQTKHSDRKRHYRSVFPCHLRICTCCTHLIIASKRFYIIQLFEMKFCTRLVIPEAFDRTTCIRWQDDRRCSGRYSSSGAAYRCDGSSWAMNLCVISQAFIKMHYYCLGINGKQK